MRKKKETVSVAEPDLIAAVQSQWRLGFMLVLEPGFRQPVAAEMCNFGGEP